MFNPETTMNQSQFLHLDQDKTFESHTEILTQYCQNHKMRFPIDYLFTYEENGMMAKLTHTISSEFDIEVLALVLTKFPYGNTNKYSMGEFYRLRDLIFLASTRYKNDGQYKSIKEFYENDPEACFDKISSIPTWNNLDQDLPDPIFNMASISTRNQLIDVYGYSSPMNFLEEEFNHMIWDSYENFRSGQSTVLDFECFVNDKKLFIRSYFNRILGNQTDLITLNEFIHSELACSYY